MASTADRIRKGFRQRVKGKGGFMSEEKHEKTLDRIGKSENLKGERRALAEDLADYDRYNSSRKARVIPYERQREMGVSNPHQPKGFYVSMDEANDRRLKNRRPRKK